MSLKNKIAVVLRDQRVAWLYFRWHLSRAIGRDPILCLSGGGRLQGFPNFSSFLGAWRYQPDLEELNYVSKATVGAKTILDVGANFGLFSIMMARSANLATIYAFEPVPSTFQALKVNLNLNFAKSVIATQIAVGSENGMVGFTDTADPATNRIDQSGNAQIKVKLTTLDAFCEERKVDGVDFLKIDVEGFELAVLKGARRLFEAGRVKRGLIEVCPGNLSSVGETCASIFDFLDQNGYDLFWPDRPDHALSRMDLCALPQFFLGNAGFSKRSIS